MSSWYWSPIVEQLRRRTKKEKFDPLPEAGDRLLITVDTDEHKGVEVGEVKVTTVHVTHTITAFDSGKKMARAHIYHSGVEDGCVPHRHYYEAIPNPMVTAGNFDVKDNYPDKHLSWQRTSP